jgi:Complex I intermediate-associated protein 30 (CIA30)
VKISQTVLIIGGLHHLSQRVVKQLWQKGYQPRLVVDAAELSTARSIFPQGLELVVGAATNLNNEDWQGVQSVIYCPAQVNQQELDALIRLANPELPNSNNRELFDFSKPDRSAQDLLNTWMAVNDGVMGGVSDGGLQIVNGRAFFKGNVSIDRGGGFASIRTQNFNPPLDLSNYQGISLKVRGSGAMQRYKIFLRPSEQWDGISYGYSFDTNANAFTDLRIPFSNLMPVKRAKIVNDAPPLERRQVSSIQIMLSKFEYDGGLNPSFRPGEFELELCSIGAYGDRTLPQLIVVAPIADTEGNVAQALAGSVRPHTLLQPATVVDATGGQELDFSLTNAPSGSVSSPDLAELCVQLLNIPEACQRTINVQEYGQLGVNNWSAMLGKAIGQ